MNFIDHKPKSALFFTAAAVCDRLVQACPDIGSPKQNPELVFPETADNTISMIAIDNIDAQLHNKPFAQESFALLLNALMAERNISIAIAGPDLPNRVPVLWKGLTVKGRNDISFV